MLKELSNVLHSNRRNKSNSSNSISKLIVNKKELTNNKEIANGLNNISQRLTKISQIPQSNNSFKKLHDESSK